MPLVNKPDPIEAIVLEHTIALIVDGGQKQKVMEAGCWVMLNNPRATGRKSQWFITIEEYRDAGYKAIDPADEAHFEERP
jgi:hypothetical protein